jgi:putative heme-binding domain-containing protein
MNWPPHTTSPLVRLHLASALQRLPASPRWALVERLAAHGEDAHDANLPLMLWYGFEPLVHDDLQRFVQVAANAQIPTVRRLAARRALETGSVTTALDALLQALSETSSADAQGDLLAGMLRALQGHQAIERPASWLAASQRLAASERASVRHQAMELAMILNDPAADRHLRELAADASQPAEARTQAIAALVTHQAEELAPLLLQLLSDQVTVRAAVRGLAQYDHPDIATNLLDRYAALQAETQQDVLQTLAARPAWALALLERVASGEIARTDLTAYTVRQLRSLQDERVLTQIQSLWGEIRETPAEKRALITTLKQQLTPDALAQADLRVGQQLFQSHCANCHRLFDSGGNIGPNLTGSQRRNLDYLLENIIDPSAAVPREYQMQLLELSSGRVVTGFVLEETDKTVTVQTVNETLVLPKADIDERQNTRVSMMPDGLLQTLTPIEVRDLIGYLQQ